MGEPVFRSRWDRARNAYRLYGGQVPYGKSMTRRRKLAWWLRVVPKRTIKAFLHGPQIMVCPRCLQRKGDLHDFEFCGPGAGIVLAEQAVPIKEAE